MKTPIEMILDNVVWIELNNPDKSNDGTPWATHEGVCEIMGRRFKCYRLNTGQRVFDVDDVNAFLGGE